MPSVQRGSIVRLESGYGVRYYDENGHRRRASGFGAGRDGKAAAVAFLNAKVAEVEAIRRGVIPRTTERPTVAELVERFLKLHDVDQATTRKLRAQLRHAVGRFGTERPNELRQLDLELWRKTLSPGVQHDAFRAFRQVLTWSVAKELATRNASVGIKNPKRKRHERREIVPFESWDDVDAIAGELDPCHRAIPIVLVGTGCDRRSSSGSTGRTSIGTRVASRASPVHARHRETGREDERIFANRAATPESARRARRDAHPD